MRNRVGLGTFPLASVFSKVTKSEAEKIVKTFLSHDGYFIDTAPLYGFGKVERLLGEVLKKIPRKNYSLMSKCGYVDVKGKTFRTVKKSCRYDDIINECEKSLKRLETDFIDIYFVHTPDPGILYDETMEALVKLQKDGKIKKIGVSNVDLSELKGYNKAGKVKFVQNRFSLVNQSIDEPFKEYLLEHKVRLIPYCPIERSQLSDRVLKPIRLRPKDLRVGRSDWKPRPLKTITSWVNDVLSPVAQDLGVSVEQLVIAWELAQKYVGFVIVGATSPEQVLVNLKANQVKLTPGVLEKIDYAYQWLEEKISEKYEKSVADFRGLNEKFY
ncbi:aldo/keto reductase [Patescibacteria group bacterium]